MEEALADLGAAIETGDFGQIEARYGVTVPAGMRPGVKSVVQRFMAWARGVYQKLTGQQFSDADVLAMLRDAREASERPATEREFLDGPAVAAITGDEFAPDGVHLTEKVPKAWAEAGSIEVGVPGVGRVRLDRRAVKASASHGIGRKKAAAFALLPDALSRAVIVDRSPMIGAPQADAYTLSAPVEIGGIAHVLIAHVHVDANGARLYVHEVVERERLQDSAFKTRAPELGSGERTGAKAGDYWALSMAGSAFQGGYVHATDPEASAQQIRRALELKGYSGKDIAAYPSGPAMALSDFPVIGVLYRGDGPAKSTQYHTDFYNALKEAREVYATVTDYRREGRAEDAQALAKENMGALRARPRLETTQERLSGIRKQIGAVMRDTSLSGAEKRQRIEALRERSNQIARRAAGE